MHSKKDLKLKFKPSFEDPKLVILQQDQDKAKMLGDIVPSFFGSKHMKSLSII